MTPQMRFLIAVIVTCMAALGLAQNPAPEVAGTSAIVSAETTAPGSSLSEIYDLWRATGGHQRDQQRAVRLATEAAATSDPLASLLEARITCFSTHDSFPPTDFQRGNQVALRHLAAVRQAAATGNSLAKYLEAFCLQHGVGVLKDSATAESLYRESAAAGVTASMVALAQIATKNKNYAEAREWLDTAADAGDFQAYILIGDIYQYGIGAPKDPPQAMKWKTKAAESGDAYALFEVGYSLNNGLNGLEKDPVKAMDYFRRSAAAGYKDAQRMLPSPPPANLGTPAKPLDVAEWAKGTTITLSEGLGKNIYVVEFWATWCPPCRTSIPHLTKLQKEFKDKGVVIVGISAEPAEVVKSFVQKQGDTMDYAVAVDNGRATNRAYMELFGEEGIPTAFIVNKEGKIVWVGHPMEMDTPLEEIVTGNYDIARTALIRNSNALISDYFKLAETSPALAREIGEKILRDGPFGGRQLNALAWRILTDDRITTPNRDLKLALRAAEAASNATGNTSGMVLDTYARALFDNGQREKAIEIQEKAVQNAENGRNAAIMKETLRQYKEAK
ncbi:MAG: redoxin domain-containing protein [Candidatus Sumerlaeaceae bacterium]|nr:redoxin domain-containing protein [Candidatus Sumerlaeaceae bacterium]